MSNILSWQIHGKSYVILGYTSTIMNANIMSMTVNSCQPWTILYSWELQYNIDSRYYETYTPDIDKYSQCDQHINSYIVFPQVY